MVEHYVLFTPRIPFNLSGKFRKHYESIYLSCNNKNDQLRNSSQMLCIVHNKNLYCLIHQWILLMSLSLLSQGYAASILSTLFLPFFFFFYNIKNSSVFIEGLLPFSSHSLFLLKNVLCIMYVFFSFVAHFHKIFVVV